MTADPEALELVATVQQELGIAGEARSDSTRALAALAADKFDLAICDCDLGVPGGGQELLRGLRLVSTNAKLIVVAMVSDAGEMQATFEHGANFVIHKPLSHDVLRRTLRAATCVMQRSARRYPRRDVDSLALVEIDGAPEKAMLTQLCEGGMGVQALEQLEVKRPLHLHFQIPGTEVDVEATGEIAWADASGRVGIRFVEITEGARDQVREWVLNEALDQASRATQAAASSVPAAKIESHAPARLLLRSGHPRLLAALLDGGIVLGATALFEGLVLALIRTAPHTLLGQATMVAVPCLFWSIYQYIFLYGATPGARLARKAVLAVAGSAGRLALLREWSAPITLRMGGTPGEEPAAITIGRA